MINAQERSLPATVSMNAPDITFEEAVKQLFLSYNVPFYYSSSKIPLSRKVNIHMENVPLTILLAELCSQAGIEYRIKENQVVFYSSSLQKGINTYTFSGYVTDSATGERLIGASIVIVELLKGTTSNAYGFFSYSLPQGNYRIQCSFIGYGTIEKDIEMIDNRQVSFSMVPQILEIKEVKLESSNANKMISLKPGTDIIPAALMSKYPALLGENDVVQFLKMMPGVQTTTDGLNGLFVRGSLPQHTSFLIDDAPMFNMYHFSGWFSTINPDAVKDVKLYKGHLPAKTGGSLASIIDIRLRDGNNQHFAVTGGIGTITSRLTIEGPIVRNRSSFIISGRRSYIDQLIKLFKLDTEVGISNYYFYDLHAKVNYTVNRKNRLYLSTYSGKDNVSDGEGTLWGNSLVSARWNHLFSDRLFTNLTLTHSSYNHQFEEYSQDNSPYQISIILRNYTAKLDLTSYTRSNHKLSFGVNTRYNILPPVRMKGNAMALIPDEEEKPYSQLISSFYFQGEFELTKQFVADAGIRLNMVNKLFPKDSKAQINPEPSLTARYSLSESSVMKGGYSRNYQYYHGANVFELIIPFDRYFFSGAKLKPQYADHLSVGYCFSDEKRSLEVSLEPFVSLIRNQYRFSSMSQDFFLNRDVEKTPVKGKTNVYGVEFSLRKLSGRFTGLLSYTLAKVEKKEVGINQGEFYNPYYDRRHDLVLGPSFQLMPRINIAATWVFMSGNPYSLPIAKYEIRGRTIPVYDNNNLYNHHMPAYHRLDLAMRFDLGKSKHIRHSLTLMVYNAYDRKNSVFYSYLDLTDGGTDTSSNKGAHNLSMLGYYSFGILPAFTYEFRF